MTSYGSALAITLAVEGPVYVVGLLELRLSGPVRAVVLALAVNLITHPVLWLLLGPDPTLGITCVAEVAVWLVEAAIIWLAVRRELPVVLLLALGANAASFCAGLWISVLGV